MDKLEASLFPYVRDAPSQGPSTVARAAPTQQSLRSAKPAWHRAARPGGGPTDIRQRMMVFVAGGMTYSEVREAYQLSQSLGKEIYIGKEVELQASIALMFSKDQRTPLRPVTLLMI